MFYWRWFNRRHHPLARLLFGVFGLVLLAVVLMLGVFALIAFAFIGAVVAITRGLTRSRVGARAASSDPRVIEGEYVVLQNRTAAVKH
ncbi:MAG: hypothetical protein ABI846_02670 [Rudaea sp.]